MSKCECCKEENSNLITYKGYKMCPACYMGYVSKVNVCENNVKYETEINQLKQENEKLFLQLSKQEIDEHKPVYCTLAGNDCKYLGKIKELKQQLEEKGKEINIKNNKLCELKKQLQNCQNEIIRLKASNKNLMSVIWKTKREKANKGRQVCQSQNESIKYKKLLDKSEQNQKLLAIQKLEKVKELLLDEYKKYPIVYDKTDDIVAGALDRDKVNEILDQQIKLLKGEKDEKGI